MRSTKIRRGGLLLMIGLLSGFLTACELRSGFRFLNNGGGAWGEGHYDDFDDGDGYGYSYSYPSNGGSNNSSGNNGNGPDADGLTFDEDSTKFGHSFANTYSGEVAIYARTSGCTDENLIVPSTYIDSRGTTYQVVKDCNNGFNALPAVSITLPDGFKQICEGFDNCMYLKKIYLPSSIEKIEEEIIVSCISLQKIDYKGTKADWNAIEKDGSWNFQAPAFVISCSDGMIEMQSWVESHPS